MLEYIGYIIEKYEQVDGSFRLVETINVPGIEFDEYYDTKVKYGVSYRYRIKAVARWVRPGDRGVLGNDPLSVPSKVEGLNSLTPNSVSYFSGEWDKKWAYAMVIDTSAPPPPDEFCVRPWSELGFVEITMKLPYNPQMHISKMTIWRKVQDEWGNNLTPWVQLTEIDAQIRQGTKLNVMSQWEHQQDDITGRNYNVTESQKTVPVVEFAPLNSRYVDSTVPYFGDGSRYKFVYAGLCHSKHGEVSKLSDQLAVRLNSHWKKDGEYDIEFVSCAGVDKDFDSGVFVTYPEQKIRSEIVCPVGSKIVLSGQPRIAKKPLFDSTYVVRVESLDTGEYVDIPANVTVNNKPDKIVEEGQTVITT